uniref:Hist_deacetyl domain-containing protein n=1 Tax=Macrostomum lignano TaxID=282301 RepID=A0A1I8F5V3_9PLAT
ATAVLQIGCTRQASRSGLQSPNFVELSAQLPKVRAPISSEFGFAYDCPPVRGAFDIASLVAGATVAAAEALSAGQFDVAITGLAVGITLNGRSFRGDSDDIGAGARSLRQRQCAAQEGVSDAQFAASFAAVIDARFEAFDPGAVVCQCGADALATDEFKIFNLTLTGYLDCVKLLLQSAGRCCSWAVAAIISRQLQLWTAITALAVGVDLDKDIPEHSFFSQYGPDFCLDVTPSLKRNLNDSTELRLLWNRRWRISNGLPRPCSCVRLSKYTSEYTLHMHAACCHPLPLSPSSYFSLSLSLS